MVHCVRFCDTGYCKRGYFRSGKISRKCWQDISRWGNFHDSTHIFLIKSYGFYFPLGEVFRKEGNITKNLKNTPKVKISTFTVCTHGIQKLPLILAQKS